MRDRAKKWTHRKAIRFTTSVSRLPFHGFVSRKKRSNREDDVRLVPILPRVEDAARAGQSCRERPRVAPRDAICSDAEDPPAYMSSTKSSHLAARLRTRYRPPRCHARLPGDCSVPVLYRCVCPGSGRVSFYRGYCTGSPPNCRHAKNTRQPKGRLPGCTQGCPESGDCPS